MILSVAGFGIAIGGASAFAQGNLSSPAARQSILEAGECTKHVGSDTLNGAKHAGEGIVTAPRGTKVTAKVKAALLVDELTGNSHVHVNTLSGVVTLSGSVLSPWVAARAEQLAEQTEGVRGVVNNLRLSGTEVSRCAQSPQSPAAKR
jgi:Flp pilus assembly secretin CpaC